MQPGVDPDAHGLVVDPHETLVANARACTVASRNTGRLGAHRHHRVDKHDEVGTLAFGDVQVTYAPDAAIDVMAIANANRAIEKGQGGRRAASARHGHIVETRSAKEHTVPRIEVVGHDAQRVHEPGKAIGDSATQEEFFQKSLERIEREETGGQRIVEPIELLPEILGGWGTRGQAVNAASKRTEAGHDGAPPLVEVHSRQVGAFEWEVVVGGIEQGAIEPLYG
jgi:hypothetical protein